MLKKKYLKYKQKYLELVNISGGGDGDDDDGGGGDGDDDDGGGEKRKNDDRLFVVPTVPTVPDYSYGYNPSEDPDMEEIRNNITNLFKPVQEDSFECGVDKNYRNVEWIYNGIISYEDIIKKDHLIYKQIEDIASISKAIDKSKHIEKETGAQQTHIHASYNKDLGFENSVTYINFILSLMYIWVTKYQILFSEKYICDFDEWASDNKNACGKPLVFSTLRNNEVTSMGDRYTLFIKDSNFYIKLFPSENTYTELFKTKFRGDTYYCSININIFINDVAKNYNKIYDNRYYDLNIVPSIIVYDDDTIKLEPHFEFRAINNLMNIGGGINDFYGDISGLRDKIIMLINDIKDIFKDTIDHVKMDDFDEKQLNFGIEIETCTKVIKKPNVSNKRPKKLMVPSLKQPF